MTVVRPLKVEDTVILMSPLSLCGKFLPHQPRKVSVGGIWGSLQSLACYMKYWWNWSLPKEGCWKFTAHVSSAACAPADTFLVEGW